MKHVVIQPNGIGGMSLTVDGVEVGGFVLRDGVVIEFRDGRAYVTLPVGPAVLTANIPDAIVQALAPEGFCVVNRDGQVIRQERDDRVVKPLEQPW